MGKVYPVPRSAKGETRLLYIFSMKSLLFTIAFGFVGLFIGYFLSLIMGGMVLIIVTGIFAVIGFGVGALKIPDSPIVGNLRKAGGEPVSDILIRTVTFAKRKKIYLYKKGGN